MARVENSPQIAMRLKTLAPFEIGFDCKPQRFLKSGEETIVFTQSNSVFNQYGEVALPVISIFYRESVSVKIGDIKIDLFGLWYINENILDKYLVKHGEGAYATDFDLEYIRFKVNSAGLNVSDFNECLDNCGGNATKLYEDFSSKSSITVEQLYGIIGYENDIFQPAFDDFLASDLESCVSLDSDTLNAYNESGDQNELINLPKFPVFEPGETKIECEGGLRRIEIVPRWWEI
jgi:phage-related protein